MTDGARELLLKLYSLKNDDNLVDPEVFYNSGKGKEFEKYAYQLKRDGFIAAENAGDEIYILQLTTDGIEAAEDEPGSKFAELMNPMPDQVDFAKLEEVLNKAITKASKDDKQKLIKMLTDMQKHAAGGKINYGNLIKDVLVLSNNWLPVIRILIAYLSIGPV